MSSELSRYVASDYAGIEISSKGIKLYYGYEVTDKDDNWCFRATFPDGEVTIPFPALQIADPRNDPFEVVECLMTGIAMLIERGDLRSGGTVLSESLQGGSQPKNKAGAVSPAQPPCDIAHVFASVEKQLFGERKL